MQARSEGLPVVDHGETTLRHKPVDAGSRMRGGAAGSLLRQCQMPATYQGRCRHANDGGDRWQPTPGGERLGVVTGRRDGHFLCPCGPENGTGSRGRGGKIMSTDKSQNAAPVHPDGSAVRRIDPDPECCQCNGVGEYAGGLICECSIVCECGEKRPNQYRKCENPGCNNHGCDSCDFVSWYESPTDPMDGIYLCESCQ